MSRNSIFHKIVIPLFFVVVLQVVILYSVFYFNGVFNELKQSFLNLLEERTQNVYQSMSVSMIDDWTNISTLYSDVNNTVSKILTEEQKTYDNLKDDSELNQKIVDSVTPELIYQLQANKITGIFFVIDGENVKDDKETYAGVYFRDNDPDSKSSDNSDLMLVRGLPPLSRKYGVALDSFWDASFTFDGGEENESNSYFYKPLNADTSANLSYKNYGYWSTPFQLDPDSNPVITYSVPLMDGNGRVYGVMGIEVKQSYLVSQLGNNQYKAYQQFCCYIGMTEDDGKTFKKVGIFSDRYHLNQIDVVSENQDLLTFEQNGYKLVGARYYLDLYNNNTEFSNQKWAIIGIVDAPSLYKESVQFNKLIFMTCAIIILIGLVISVIVSMSIDKPIKQLIDALKSKHTQGPLQLPLTHIEEIDALSDSIMTMSQEIVTSANRTSKLIELSGLPVGVYEVRQDPIIVYCSDGFFRLLDCEELKNSENLISYESLQTVLNKATSKPVELNAYEILVKGETRFIKIVRQKDQNTTIGAIMDVTDEIQDQRRLKKERNHDALTGIYNRRGFEEKLDLLLENAKTRHCYGAMVMFDLDNLKFINDSFGHDYGDRYIIAFANVLVSYCDENTLIARRSGDEFYMFIHGFESHNLVKERIYTIWNSLTNNGFELPDGSEYRLRASGGICWYPSDSYERNQMIQYADYAMYQAKHDQKGSIREFDLQQYQENAFLIRGHGALNRLIDDEMVNFMVQPIYSALDGSVYGYELLMRSEVEELKTPDLVLRMAKSQGKLYYIEQLTWKKGLQCAKRMIDEGKISSSAKIFINSIANQSLRENDKRMLVTSFSTILPQVVMEVTESENNNMEWTIDKLDFVKKFGGQVAIDDFGTGYNSEMALVMIPSNIVKIDIAFVRNVDRDSEKQILIKNLISFAKQKNIAVLAEGVETKEELETLISFGVDFIQGFYLGRPTYNPQPLSSEKQELIVKMNEKYRR